MSGNNNITVSSYTTDYYTLHIRAWVMGVGHVFKYNRYITPRYRLTNHIAKTKQYLRLSVISVSCISMSQAYRKQQAILGGYSRNIRKITLVQQHPTVVGLGKRTEELLALFDAREVQSNRSGAQTLGNARYRTCDNKRIRRTNECGLGNMPEGPPR